MGRTLDEFKYHPVGYSSLKGNEKRGVLKHVVDGDTVDVLLDLGFQKFGYECIRLENVFAPEIRGEEKEAGRDAKRYVKNYEGLPVVVKTGKGKTFDRYVGQIEVYVGEYHWNFNQQINEYLAGGITDQGQGVSKLSEDELKRSKQ